MLNSSCFDKGSSVAPENFASGRNNISNRFPVGITSLGDESQQNRIQLAVHKYNNLSNNPINNRRCLISPVRHSILKNSPKAKCYESDAESVMKNERKCGNRYEGVGVFPTVHLKKHSVLYRPIRKFNEVKVPYPELPVNRFLNNVPELCPELKSNTRSVLDVLQDLSRKRIHSKDESDCKKIRSKGLGGDISAEAEALYKPLFVQRPKINTVLTRDNTTQTLSSHGMDATNSGPSDPSCKKDVSDSKVELRKRLAKQNNEIFASLSSSIMSPVAIKRKIDKAENGKETNHLNDMSNAKKRKFYENCVNGREENGILKFVNGFTKSNSNDNVTKGNRKSKLNDSNTVSPNRDRLTTIFLDMRNTSPKTQVFQTNSDLNENSLEKSTLVSDSASMSSTNKTSLSSEEKRKASVDSSAELQSASSDKIGTTSTVSPNLNFVFGAKTVSSSTPSESKEKDGKTELNTSLNTPVSKSDISNSASNISNTNFTPTQMNFKSNASNVNFGSQLKAPESLETSENSQNKGLLSTATSPPSENAKIISNSTDTNDSTKSLTEVNDNKIRLAASTPFTFGVSNANGLQKPNFSSFKFGTEGSLTSTQNQQSVLNPNLNSFVNTVQTSKSDTSATTNTTTSSVSMNTMPQFSFVAKTCTSTNQTSLPASTFQFGQTISTSNTSIPSANSLKPVYTFGKTAFSPSNQQNSSENVNKIDEKLEPPKTDSSISADVKSNQISSSTNNSNIFGQNVQSSKPFIFGQKSENVETSANSSGQNIVGNVTNQASSFGQTTANQGNSFSKSESTFGTAIISQGNNLVPASSVPSTTFSQNPALQTSNSTGVQSSGTNSLFTFGQKPATPEVSNASLGSGVPVNTSTDQKSQPAFSFSFAQKSETLGTNQNKSEAGVFGQKAQTNLFSLGQKPSGKESVQNTGSTATTQASLFEQNLPKPLMQSPVKQPLLFGQNVTQASTTPQTTSSSTAFGQSQNSAPLTTTAFGTKSNSVSFGQVSAPSFGQNNNTFTTSSSVFGAATTQSSGFGAPATTQSVSGFGTPASSQGLSTFATPAVTQSASGFGVPTTGNSGTGFGTGVTGFPSTASTPCSTSFGAPATQPSSGFGINSGSFNQTFGQNNKSTTSFAQNSTFIFGQTTANQGQGTGTGFSAPPTSNLGNIFGQANKAQSSPFGQNSTTQPFGGQMKYPFGMSTSNTTEFTSTPPSTTTPSLFSFGGNNPGQGSAYSFGSTASSGSTNTSTPFVFNSPNSDTFKFGASTSKEGQPSGFGTTNTSTFSFGAQMNNNVSSEAKPPRTAFNFGNSQVSSAPVFNFGSTPSSSVFSFGGSGSSSSGSTFSFGTPQPNAPFGQSPSPATPFSVPGTFSIGSGSSQSRPRASSRLRRRP